ncbi:hypothetical protein OHA27_10520 [Streptomyces sp. NBC_01619]|uniref:hypothetical protein n=1 Tax=unclassified Streptomyces TaxID=2593676 RepID=UPI002254C024|nr:MULTISPECIES: hypothetical protein [unclassified Streptomyces]MCX4510728.1 hypothetical protein [Streptomyces sp. NBC_01619]
MNKLMRRIAITTISVALAGTTVVGTTGSASAAPRATAQEQRDVSTVVADRHGGRHDQEGRWRWDPERWDRDQAGFWYWHGNDRHHYWFDGHRYFRWIGGEWIVFVPTGHHHGDVDWHADQVLDSENHHTPKR